MNGWVVLTLMAFAGLTIYTIDYLIHPFTNCGRCNGQGRFTSPLSRKRWRPCRKCGGTGQRTHPMVAVLKVFGVKRR